MSSAAAGLGEKRRDTICIGGDSPISMAANLGAVWLPHNLKVSVRRNYAIATLSLVTFFGPVKTMEQSGIAAKGNR